MSIIKKPYFDINNYNIKVIGEKYNSKSDTYKKGCLLAELKTSESSNFYDIGLLAEHLESTHLKHEPTEVTVTIEIKQSDREH